MIRNVIRTVIGWKPLIQRIRLRFVNMRPGRLDKAFKLRLSRQKRDVWYAYNRAMLAQVAKEQMPVFGRFGVHISIIFWVELNVNDVCMSQATFFVAFAAYIQFCI